MSKLLRRLRKVLTMDSQAREQARMKRIIWRAMQRPDYRPCGLEN